jgi:hypothetical protein
MAYLFHRIGERRGILEPLRTQECGQQVNEEKHGDKRGEYDHGASYTFSQP